MQHQECLCVRADEGKAEFGSGPLPYPVERSLAIKALALSSASNGELIRFVQFGQSSKPFAFDTEVTAALAEALRLVLTIERSRFENFSELTLAEAETASALFVAIEAFQKEWGNGDSN